MGSGDVPISQEGMPSGLNFFGVSPLPPSLFGATPIVLIGHAPKNLGADGPAPKNQTGDLIGAVPHGPELPASGPGAGDLGNWRGSATI